MSTFDLFVTQPILNIILAIYAIIGDMGIAVILFAILVRLLMGGMIKKQLHQTRLMRKIQPELKRIKVEAAGDKQKEGQLMLELYKEHGVKPFASLTPLLIQVPVFFALYQIALLLTTRQGELPNFIYSFMKDVPVLMEVAKNPGAINEKFLGFLDLAHPALTPAGMNVALLGLVLVSAALQFYQSKQLVPKDQEKRRLRDLLRPKDGQTDAAEMNQAIMSKMMYFFPIFAVVVGVYLPGILMMFYAASSAIAIWQQKRILDQDVDEMEVIARKKSAKAPKKATNTVEKRKNVTVRVTTATEAEIVKKPTKKVTKAKKKGKRL